MRGPRTAMKSGPRLPQLDKALAQKRRPNTAINKINKIKKKKEKKTLPIKKKKRSTDLLHNNVNILNTAELYT